MTQDQVLDWYANWRLAAEAARTTLAVEVDETMRELGYQRDGDQWTRVPAPRPAPVPLPVPQPRPPADTEVRAYVRESLDADRTADRRWADRLTPAERGVLAAILGREAARYLARGRRRHVPPARVAAAAECLDLRAEVAA